MDEVRGIWMHPESQFDADPERGRDQIKAFVSRMADAHFNLILPWLTSEYMAAVEDEVYQKAHPTARWDALAALIDAAEERGLQVQPWYSFTYYKSPASPEFRQHPEWAGLRADEVAPDPATGKVAARRMADVCPQHPGARAWQIDLVRRVMDRYPKVTGFHVEEPGFGYRGNCLCEVCTAVFRAVYGGEPLEHLDGPELEDIKCLGTSDFMRRAREMLLKRDPKLIFSTNGGYSWKSDRGLGRDWGRWARMGWLDYYASQIYTPDTAKFRERTEVILRDIGAHCPVYIGIAADWSGGSNTAEEVVRQIEETRRLGARGVVLFHGAAMTDEYLDALRKGPFREGAMYPGVVRTK